MNPVQIIMAEIMNDPAPAIGVWKNYNCPACVYRGQSRPDVRHRGNHMFTSEGSVVYNCYNCHLKTVWSPGKFMSKDMMSLLSYFGASEKALTEIQFYVKEMVESGEFASEETAAQRLYQRITKREFPPGTKSFLEWVNSENVPEQFWSVLNAVNERNQYLLDLELYWSPAKDNRMYDRFIIPYYMNGQIIGYTARHKDVDSNFRYVNQVSTSLLYNFDLLNDPNIRTILVAEGPIDAALMGGVSANNYFLSAAQIEVLKAAQERGKRIVIVPDRDKDGLVTIEQAIELGFSVSFPDFGAVRDSNGIRHVKDFDEACAKYGRLFCIQLIHASIVDEPFDIRVQTDKWI